MFGQVGVVPEADRVFFSTPKEADFWMMAFTMAGGSSATAKPTRQQTEQKDGGEDSHEGTPWVGEDGRGGTNGDPYHTNSKRYDQ